MMILKDAKWDEFYKERKELPDPVRQETDDEKNLYAVFKITIPKDPSR